MSGNPKQKLKLLYIADILKKYTDEEHAMAVGEIIEHLEKEGIVAERKSVYNDIKVLRDYGMPIINGNEPVRGFFYAGGEFQLSELMMLIDAVQASPVITRKKTKEFIEKLRSMASVHQSQQLESQIYIDNRFKSENEEIYYNIDRIKQAVNRGVKIKFIYQRRQLVGNIPVLDTGREFVISPYATIWNDDKYYLVGNYDKYDDLSHYRIDKMKRVECTDEPARDFREVCGYTTRFDAADYTRRVFNMFAGANQRGVELICENRLLEAMIERFGISVPYKQIDSEHFMIKVYAVANDGLEQWILNFGGGVVVKSPSELRDSIKKRLESMLESYK